MSSPDAYDDPMTSPPADARYLRSALEFAIEMARQGAKLRPPARYPTRLKRYLSAEVVATSNLVAVRRIIESDPDYRQRLARGALPELVDPIGQLWLARPDGWEAQIEELVAQAEIEARDADLSRQLARADRRRVAAEQATVRTRAELVTLADTVADRDRQLALVAGQVADLEDRLASLTEEVSQARREARHARDRQLAAEQRLAAAQTELDQARLSQSAAEEVRDEALADRADSLADRSELLRLADLAGSLSTQLASLVAIDDSTPETRVPLALPGGLTRDSRDGARFLITSGASIIVDGYNISQLAWPGLALVDQRRRLIDALEDLAKTTGSDITVVFDGAHVVGAHGQRRLVRVVFSPPEVIADDIIRDEVRRLPASRSVVVVTNDAEIITDIRAMGANPLPSHALIGLFR